MADPNQDQAEVQPDAVNDPITDPCSQPHEAEVVHATSQIEPPEESKAG